MSFVSFQIPDELRAAVKALQADGVNMSALLRRLLRAHIEQTAKKEANQHF